MKPIHRLSLLAVAPLCLGMSAFAQENTEKTVAFRAGDTRYASTIARGGLALKGQEIGGNQTFVLTDFNGGTLADGDSIRIRWALPGLKPTYWQESQGSISRIGGRPDETSTFRVKALNDGAITLQTASGKFVGSSQDSRLVVVEEQASAVVWRIVEVPKPDENEKITAPATLVVPAPPTTPVAPVTAVAPLPTVVTPTTPPLPTAPATPAATATPAALSRTPRKFDFGSGPVAPGYIQVLPTTLFTPETGHGFEDGAQMTAQNHGKPDALRGDSIGSDTPFRFSVALPEGNYNVVLTLGDVKSASNTTVKAEARRLMLQEVQTKPGQFVTRTFTVNVHTPTIPGNSRGVGLKSGEASTSWDEKLTLEFNGSKPFVCAMEITPAENVLAVFVAGDSTVTDQGGEPWAAWGQMLPRFFKPGVAVANYAQSGLTLASFRAQRRLDKIISTLKPGDYVFIQFGHNDQKEKGGSASTTYKTRLKEYVAAVREKAGIPVLLTPMERRRWNRDGKPESTLSDFAEAVRQVGQEDNVPVIDLNAMSLKLYLALGPEGSKKAFVHYAANTLPGQSEAIADNTHFSNYGAYELARCVVEGIKTNVPTLARSLTEDAGTFDPSKPDAADAFGVPASPVIVSEKPAGS